MNVTIKHGTQTMSKHFAESPTVNQVISSASVKAELGYGDNVRALVNGVEQAGNAIIDDGSTVVVETKANSKAFSLLGFRFQISW